ncbi:hypothetical protein [Dietzia sp. 179-F 9C3 NHS]|uniref:hypothetical protein n=1 Tax=Dietzia sp. 179-F 9C3 NHS TaxID=3374295 RepID=UPI00387A33BE
MRARRTAPAAGLALVALAVAGCSAAEAPLPVLDSDARPTDAVKREVNASVTEIVGTLTAHDAEASRTLVAGDDYGPCEEGGRGERVGYDFGAIWLESPSFARDWDALAPRVEQAAQRHGYTLAEEQPAADAERTLVFRNLDADRVEVAVTPTSVGTSAGSSCFPPAD